MVLKKGIRKKIILFLCFVIFLHIHPLVPSSLIVMGNEIESEEGENDPEEIGIESDETDPANTDEDTVETETNEVMTLQEEGEQEPTIIILSPDESGLSFNELIEVSGEVTDDIDRTEKLTLTVFKVEEEEPFKIYEDIEINGDGTWNYVLILDETESGEESAYLYEEGQYRLQMTIDSSEFFSDELGFFVDRTAPEIVITSPDSDTFTNKAAIEGETEADATVSLYRIVDGEDNELIGDPITSDAEGNFAFTLTIDDGEYTFLVTSEDAAGNVGEEEITFIYDGTRPFISTESLFPKPKMTQVSLENLKVKAKIIDENIDFAAIGNPIEVTEQGTGNKITGTYEIQGELIIFTPSAGEIKANTKYLVLINPLIQDKAGNLIHSRHWSFMTETQTNVGSPHGGYLNNMNTCKICHGVHAAPEAKVQQVSLEYTDDPDGELDGKGTPDAINGYCMSCHDGTVASNMTGHQEQRSNHAVQLIRQDNGKIESQSCGNCHNVHLDWHPSNPNSLKDHFVFDHTSVAGADGVGKISSSETLCESCHEHNLGDIVTIDMYEVFTYRDWNTSSEDLSNGDHFGTANDYSLCLRCHNGEYANIYEGVVNIEKYYTNEGSLEKNDTTIYSGHFINSEKINDGSLLNGNMPCADCHDTHSSSNVSLIKSELGHNNASSFEQADAWTDAAVRQFCLSCHNGETELYGITVSLKNKERFGHRDSDTKSCADCHGGTLLEAAHFPDDRRK